VKLVVCWLVSGIVGLEERGERLFIELEVGGKKVLQEDS